MSGITDTGQVEILESDDPGARWRPKIGSETLSLLSEMSALSDAERRQLREESLSIIRACAPPDGPDTTEIGLVVGLVQSGKTMSFTAVTALARDNLYPLVIIITGTSVPLTNQSVTRLEKDLRLQARPDRAWQHFHNPRPRYARDAIAATLADWGDPDVPPAARQSVLITVMKNHRHLAQLNNVLAKLDLKRTPAIIIDDEADQAGLNNLINQGRRSTTYEHLTALRTLVPHHSYLQYTATPQAPLLINIIDALSPRFAEVLTPGEDYVGGEEFFVTHRRLVRTIPSEEIFGPEHDLVEPPKSLLEAMQIFYLGVASGMLEGGPNNRSMMVHPSQQRLLHGEYCRWVNQVKGHWQSLLELPEADAEKQELLEEFREAYADLAQTVQSLSPFDQLAKALKRAIRKTRVWEVNTTSGKTPAIDWRGDYSHILVGGQAMDRGFTVNGLTVTYMPRGTGTGVADTIQQRARFFGYKRQYLGYCRIYLEVDARNAYGVYVGHEDNVRRLLVEHRRSGRPLSEWKRAFFLDAQLKPTRRSVIQLDYLQDEFSDQWWTPVAPHDSDAAIDDNRRTLDAFLQNLTFTPDAGSPKRTEMQRHGVVEALSLSRAFETLLTRFRVSRLTDSQRFTGLLLQVKDCLDRGLTTGCRIYYMSNGSLRQRAVDKSDEIPNLFQGADPVDPPSQRGSIYPGDRHVKARTGLTVQIHRLNVKLKTRVLKDVPTLAIWIPEEMAKGWLVQQDGH